MRRFKWLNAKTLKKEEPVLENFIKSFKKKIFSKKELAPAPTSGRSTEDSVAPNTYMGIDVATTGSSHAYAGITQYDNNVSIPGVSIVNNTVSASGISQFTPPCLRREPREWDFSPMRSAALIPQDIMRGTRINISREDLDRTAEIRIRPGEELRAGNFVFARGCAVPFGIITQIDQRIEAGRSVETNFTIELL